MYDVLVIGAGVIGAAIARELSKYEMKIGLIEKESDVSLGASKANSGIVHGGYAGANGTLKGRLCIRGNQMYDQLNKELNFGFKRIGGMIIGFDAFDQIELKKQMENGKLVGQDDFEWLDQAEVRLKEPHINPDVQFALYMPSIGVTSPYEMTIALVENAQKNGVELLLNHEVLNITFDHIYSIDTNKGILKTKMVINAAGIQADVINGFFDDTLTIKKRRGQYIIFGKDQSHLVNHVIFQPPTEKGKGILVTQTYHGNFMIGPDAEDLMDELKTETTLDRITGIVKEARKSIPDFELRRALTTFSGIRSISDTKDFFIKEVKNGFFTVGGVDSPGLTSAPAIAEYVRDLVLSKEIYKKKKHFINNRNSYYQDTQDVTVCFCELKSEKEIQNCLKGIIPIHSTDAIKRRIRAGMGNCQGKRCENVVRQLIAKHHNIDTKEISKRTEEFSPNRVMIESIKKIDNM